MDIQKIEIKPSQFILVDNDSKIDKTTPVCYCYNSIKNTWNDDIVLYQGCMPMYHYIGFKIIVAASKELNLKNILTIEEYVNNSN